MNIWQDGFGEILYSDPLLLEIQLKQVLLSHEKIFSSILKNISQIFYYFSSTIDFAH